MDRSDWSWPTFVFVMSALFVVSGMIFVLIGLANGSGACK